MHMSLRKKHFHILNIYVTRSGLFNCLKHRRYIKRLNLQFRFFICLKAFITLLFESDTIYRKIVIFTFSSLEAYLKKNLVWIRIMPIGPAKLMTRQIAEIDYFKQLYAQCLFKGKGAVEITRAGCSGCAPQTIRYYLIRWETLQLFLRLARAIVAWYYEKKLKHF